MDGKHFKIRSPFHSASEFYNYKGDFSIILLALVDDQYCFTYIDVGANGRASDGGVFARSTLKNAVENKELNLPPNTVFLADDAFPLTEYLLKPFSHHGSLTIKEKIFNYRLSRARRIAENAFGVLVSRFRIFEKPIPVYPETAVAIIKVACVLHNWLRKTTSTCIYQGCVDEEDFESGTISYGSWRREVSGACVSDLVSNQGRNYSKKAAEMRNHLAEWFMSDGAVPWQMNMITK